MIFSKIQQCKFKANYQFLFFFLSFFFFPPLFIAWIVLFCTSLFRAPLVAYGSSQARGQIKAAAADLRHSHSNVRSKPHLRPIPQLTTTPDPSSTEQGQELNPHLHRYQLDSLLLSQNGNSSNYQLLKKQRVRNNTFQSLIFLTCHW